MARIPTYDASVAIQPQAVVSRAEGENALNNLAKGATQVIENDYQRRQIVQAKQQGAIAGEDPNFKPTQGFGAATAAYNQAALQAQKYTLGSDILLHTNNIYHDSLTNLNDATPTNYKKSFDAYANGVLENAHPANTPYLKNLLDHQYVSGLSKIQDKLLTNARHEAAFTLDNNLNILTNETSNLAREGNLNSALSGLGQIKAQATKAMQAALIKPSGAATYITNAQTHMAEQYALGQYEKSGFSNDFIKQFRESKDYDKFMSADQKDATIAKMNGLRKQHLAELGINKQTINDAKKNIQFQAMRGAPISPSQLNFVNEADPNNAQNFTQDVSRWEMYGQIVHSHQYDNINNMSSAITQLNQEPTKAELASDEGFKNYQVRQQAANELQAQRKDFLDDPAGYTQNDPLYQKKYQEFRETGQGDLPQSMIDIQRQRGLNDSQIRVIPNAVAAQMVGKINQLPLAQQVAALQDIQQKYGDASYFAMRDLAHSGLSQATQVLVNMPNDTQGAALYPVALQALSTPTKMLEDNLPAGIKKSQIMAKVKNSLGTWMNTVAGYNGVPQDYVNSITQQVYKTSLLLHSQGDSNAEQHAADAMINSHYVFDSLKGYNYRIPVKYTNQQSTIREAANVALISLEKQDLKIPVFYQSQLQGIPIDKIQQEYKKLLQPHFITSSDENSLIMVDSSGAPILTKSNQTLTIPFDKAQDFINENKKSYQDYLINQQAFSRLPVLAAFENRRPS